MQLFDYKCKNCGATLQLDLDHLQGFCQYCGSRVLIESSALSMVLVEREKTERTKMNHAHEERMLDKRIVAEKKAARSEAIKTFLSGDNAAVVIFFVIWFFFIFLLEGWLALSELFGSFKTYSLPFSNEVIAGSKLDIVQETLSNAEFDKVSIGATMDSGGKTLSEGEVVKILVNGDENFDIEKKYKKEDIPSIVILVYTPDGNFAFPYSSSDVKGQAVYRVRGTLSSMGFSNIQTREKQKVLGFLGESDAIVDMTVSGKKMFKSGDRFPLDVPIVIEYYD